MLRTGCEGEPKQGQHLQSRASEQPLGRGQQSYDWACKNMGRAGQEMPIPVLPHRTLRHSPRPRRVRAASSLGRTWGARPLISPSPVDEVEIARYDDKGQGRWEMETGDDGEGFEERF